MEQSRGIPNPNPSIDSTFSSLPSFTFSSSSSSSARSGLSKPRLVKQRRRVPRLAKTDDLDLDGQTRLVSEKIDTWNPFHSPNLPNATEGAPSSGKGFVFGSSASFPASYSTAADKNGNFMGFGRSSESGSVSGSAAFLFEGDAKKTSSSTEFGKEACILEMGKLHVGTKEVDHDSAVFGESLASTLPNQMGKLNIGKSGYEQRVEGNLDDKPDDNKKTAGAFIFGQSSPMLSQSTVTSFQEKFRNLNVGSSVGGIGFSHADKAGAQKSDIPDKNLDFKLHGDVNNFNMNSSGSDIGRHRMQETDAHISNAGGKGDFTFGRSKNIVNSSDDDIANKIPERFKKLNIENQSLKNLEDINKDSEGVSAFLDLHETGVKKTFAPAENMSNNAEKCTSDNFLGDTLKLKNGDPVNNISNIFENANVGDSNSQGSIADMCAFPYSKNNCSSDIRNKFHLPKKEALFSGIGEKLNSEPYKNVKHNDPITGSSTILESKFHADNQGIATGSSYSSFIDPGFTSVAADFTFTGCGVGASYVDYKTLHKDPPFPSEENMFTEMRQNLAFSTKKEVKDSRSRKCKGKSRRDAQHHQRMDSASFQRDKSSKENSELGSPGHYSPMDFSPYEEILVSDAHSGPSVVPSGTFDSHHTSMNVQHSVSFEEIGDPISAAQHLDVTEDDNCIKNSELQEDDAKDDSECFLDAKSSFLEEEDGEEEVESGRKDKEGTTENISSCYSSYSDLTEDKFSFSSSSSIRKHPSEGKQDFVFCSALNNGSHDAKPNESNFTFATDASTQCPSSLLKQFHKRKSRAKNTKKSYKTTPSGKFNVDSSPTILSPHLCSSLQSNSTRKHGHEGASFISEKILEKKVAGSKDPEVKEESTPSTILSAAREACENWRLKGNQAYTRGNLSKAEDYYTRGLNCVSPNEKSRSCSHLLVLCYSNRAATRMSLGRMREALNDCLVAIAIEPNFHKAQLRAANCYLALGETEDASNLFKKCFQFFNGDNPSSKVLEEASDGLRKAQLVAKGMCRSSEILQTRMCADVTNALETISEILLISPQSERLLEMKAEALLLLRKYDEVIELCEKTMKSSEINSPFVRADDLLEEGDTKHIKPYEIWRWHLISRSYFYLGKLEEAIQFLQSHGLVGSIPAKCRSKSLESFALFFDVVKELLRLKVMGNNAFKERRHLEAVEHYTAALACSVESRPFAAICFCNRAAAYQALNQISDAIADCSLAIALDANYPKAISRRATLYELIRDYDQANNDLGRLISLLKKQSGVMVSPAGDGGTLTRARARLACVQEEARRGIPLNMYKILGIESSSNTVDIKKAYRKAALKHHPDKVVQLLVKGEKSNDNVWNDVSDEVHKDADRVFKMIGEAYSILSDSTKREQYDAEEEMRIILKKGDGMSQKYTGEFQYSRSDKSNMRRHSECSWNSHGRPRQRWSESAYSTKYYY